MAFKVLQLRRDTAANWTSNDPTLAEGEIGVETDTLKFKIGDGSTAWTAPLAYQSASYSDEEAQDAVGGMIADTNTVDLTYTDATPELKADVLYQDSTSINLSDDASGLKADVLISSSPGDVTITAEADGLKADIDAIDLGASV